MEKCMWRKHCSVFQDHLKYICNAIVKPFCVRILRYAERVQDMQNLEKHLPPPSMKVDIFESDIWKGRYKEFSVNEIRVDIKDVLPLFIQDELEDNKEDYYSLTHEDWYDLLSTIKVKDNRKRAVTQIKEISTLRAASNYDRNDPVRVTRNKKKSTGV